MSNMLVALSQVPNADVNRDSVAICAPYFPNGDDKNVGYPWVSGLSPGLGSNTSALVWSGSNFADGADNSYPHKTQTVSSYNSVDQLIRYFDNKSIYPNLEQIVIAGHSLGAQFTQRYAMIGGSLGTTAKITYYVANPDSFAWLSDTRPLDTSTCPTYDVWRYGLTNYTVECSYQASFVLQGRSAVVARYNSRQIAYARGTLDTGDDSSTCAPLSQGANRAERALNFFKAFPPTCTSGDICDTIDYVVMGHDAAGMFSSPAGQARLFLDNFNGTGNMAYDFGCPRLQPGDNPFPDPASNCTSNSNTITYAGNMTYAGCWQDINQNILPLKIYANSSNTIELCTTACNAAGYTIAGLEDGLQCYCGNSLAHSALETVQAGCTIACSGKSSPPIPNSRRLTDILGNSSEICGDLNRVSLYSNGTPNILAVPQTPATVDGFNYTGCYMDNNPSRSLTGLSTTSSNMTLENCATFCVGYKYFGTEYSESKPLFTTPERKISNRTLTSDSYGMLLW